MDDKLLSNSLSAILGHFSPTNLGSRLFMERTEMETPEKFLIWFHERFHYLQVIFTSYGQLKWGAYRTSVVDITECWATLSNKLNQPKKIPIYEYLLDDTYDSTKLAYNIWFHDLKNDLYKIVDYGTATYDSFHLFNEFSKSTCCPIISLFNQDYYLRGIDILESFAKFEEAMLCEIITGKKIDDTINPSVLNPEYYSALYYFVDILGQERLIEFPVVCELSLAAAHTPSPSSLNGFIQNAPNWRFVKIIQTIKNLKDLPIIDCNDDNSFYEYCKVVLRACEFEPLDKVWKVAEEYANMSDLTMAKEMKAAIKYKREHPWMLSYPMLHTGDFLSKEFNRFQPYFTITNDVVSYNLDCISSEELIFENHLQAFAQQICGHISKYCCDSFKLMCGYSYIGMNTCPNYLAGECTGYIDHNSHLPELILDEHLNIKSGCTFKIFLETYNINLKDIHIGLMRPITYDQITSAAKKHSKTQP